MLDSRMNPGFHPQTARNLQLKLHPSRSKLHRFLNFFPLIVNQQAPQNQHLQNSIKTNNFNSFAINTYAKPGGVGSYC